QPLPAPDRSADRRPGARRCRQRQEADRYLRQPEQVQPDRQSRHEGEYREVHAAVPLLETESASTRPGGSGSPPGRSALDGGDTMDGTTATGPRGKLADRAHRYLRDGILNGDLPPGTVLAETELAE